MKIGFTERQAPERAAELYSTGVPQPFRVVHSWSVENAVATEKEVHFALAKYRVNGNREFFRLSPDNALRLISRFLDSAASNYSAGSKTEECAFVNCKDIGIIQVAGRFFCPKCSSRIRSGIRRAKCNFDRLTFLSQKLKPLSVPKW